jgi:hypothetical protein
MNSMGCIKSTGSFNESDPSLVSFEGIQFKSKRYSVYVEKQLQIPLSDLKGQAPFTFSIDQGIGAIDQTTGLYQAPSVLGFAVISVKDGEGRLGYVSIEVVDDLKVKTTDFAMVTGTSYLLQISGGKYPYQFVVEKGDVTVDRLGVVKAGSIEGPAKLRVLDGLGNFQVVSIDVVKNVNIQPTEFSVQVSEAKDLTLLGGVGLAQLSLNTGVGTVSNVPPRFTAGVSTGSAVVAATDEMGNVGYAYGRVFGTLQISPHLLKIPKGESYNHFEALGGVPPFTFSIQGTGTIDAVTGQYVAASALGSDVITVTDALGHTSQANVTVTAATRFLARNAIVQIGDTVDFNLLIDGGAEPITLSVSAGQGSVAGKVYTPPSTTGNYTVSVSESGGMITQAIILVYPSFNILPTQLNIAIDSQDFFSALGGVPPYVFQVVSGLGSINAQTGAYSSGSQVGTAVVKVTDAQNHMMQATVQIKNRLTLVADAQSVEGGGVVNFTASGGLSPYTFSSVSGNGTLAANGADKAVLTTGLTAGIVQIEAKDSIGNRVSNYIQVLAKLMTIPPNLSLKVNQQYFFGAQGGLGPYQFLLMAGNGTVTSDGLYKAPSQPSTDQLQVTDSSGHTSEASIIVYENMQILPQSQTILEGQSLQMSVTGGAAPLAYSITSGGGTITTQGLFTSANIAGTVIIHVTDSQGNFSDAVIVVNPALTIVPSSISIKTNKSYVFAAAGGIPPYQFSVTSGNGGAINSATGEYTAPGTAGNYQVQAKDQAGNIALATVSVSNSGNGGGSSNPGHHLVDVSGNNQSGTVNTVLAQSLQVKVLDSNGDPVSGEVLKVTVQSGSGNPGMATITSGVDGIATVPYFLSTQAGNSLVRIEPISTTFVGTPAFIDFAATAIPAAPAVASSAIATSISSGVPADGVTTAAITVTLKDIYNNPIPGKTVSLSASGTGNTLTPTSGTTNASGDVSATLASTVAGPKTLSFTAPPELAGLTTVIGFGPTATPDSSKSTIIGTSNVIADGVAMASVTVNLKSVDDTPASGFVPTFTATDTGGTNTYGTCSLSDGAGNSVCTIASTKAETKILTILTPVNKIGGSITFVHGAANKLAFTQQPVSAAVNSALSPQPIAELQDVFGNRINTGAESGAGLTLTLISGVGAMAGTAATTTVAGVADFNGKNIAFDRPGAKVIRAALGTFSIDSAPFGVISIPTKIEWSGNTSISRGTCAALSLNLFDTNNDITTWSADVNVALAGVGTGTFYSDSVCTTPLVGATISQGTASKVVYYLNNTTGAQNLTADVAGFATATYPIAVIPGAASKLGWSGPSAANLGVCSSAFTLTSKDSSDQATTVVSNTTVSLAGNGNGQFFSNATCTAVITEVTIDAGNSTATLYFKDAVKEVLTFAATATGLSQGVYPLQSKYPDLYISGTGGSTLDGVAITSCGGGAVCNSTNPLNPHAITTVANATPVNMLNFNSITTANAAYLSTAAWNGVNAPAAGNGVIDLTIDADVSICASCVVQVSTRGYSQNQGAGRGTGGGNGGGGASYGGKGGGASTGQTGGVVYGSYSDPIEMGSGGGNGGGWVGGTGGGLVKLNVLGTFTLDGKIYANGGNGDTSGGWCGVSAGSGSGGGINIVAGTLAGTGGVLQAIGGTSASAGCNGSLGGGGAGGRIAVKYATDLYAGTYVTLAALANGGYGSGYGSAGTIYFKNNSTLEDELVLDQNSAGVVSTTFSQDTTLTRLTVKRNAQLEVAAGVSLNVTGSYNYAGGYMVNRGTLVNPLVDLNWTLYNYGTLTLPGGNLTIKSGGNLIDYVNVTFNNVTIENGGTQTLAMMPTTFNELDIQNGGVLTHLGNSVNKNYWVDVIATQLLVNGKIDVSGRGHAQNQGFGKGISGAATGGGGGYGGQGGQTNTGQIGGSMSGSLYDPTDLGSGGASSTNGVAGGAGGGSIKLSVSGTLTLNGKIYANGSPGSEACNYSAGGGAGGSIKITTGTLAGAGGEIQSVGGLSPYTFGLGCTSGNRGGGGSGGRIAVYYGTDAYVGNYQNITALANGGNGATYGSAGTVYFKNSTTLADHLIYNQNTGGASSTFLAENLTVAKLTIKNNAQLEIPTGMSLSVTDSADYLGGVMVNRGTLVNPVVNLNWVLYNFGTVTYPAGDLTIKSGGHLIDYMTNTFNNVTIENGGTQSLVVMPTNYNLLDVQTGGLITHLANSTNQTYWVDINASDMLLNGQINVTVKGFTQNQGPGKGISGSATGSGGAYGGVGGNSNQGQTGGAAYGVASDPNSLGSGGGSGGSSAGGTGGGLAKLNVAGTFTLNGKIYANGGAGNQACNISTGGGAGGGVKITAGTIAGAGGEIQALGAYSPYTIGMGCGSGWRGGGGSGGRVAIIYNTDSYNSGVQNLMITATGGTGGTNGAPGSIYLRPTKLVWGGATTVNSGSCSNPITINAQGASSLAALVLSDTLVTLAGAGSGSFYSDAGCTFPITQVTLTTGTSGATVYFKDSSLEALAFTANATGLTQGNLSFQSVNGGPGAPDHLVYLAGQSQTGAVMTVLPLSLQVKVVDSAGNPVPGTALQVTVTSGTGSPGYASLTTAADGTASTPYFLGSVTGTEVIRIESSGVAFPGVPAFIDFNATATPGTPSTATSTLIASPSAGTPADGVATTTVTATIKDVYGNAVPNAPVTLAATGSGNSLTPSTGTSNTSGQFVATLATTVAENKTINFAAPAGLATLNTVVGFGTTVTPDATTSTITGTSNVVADGVATVAVTINLKSATNEPASGFVPTFSATDTNGTNTYGACSLSDVAGNSTCTLASTKAETKILTILTPVNKVGGAVTLINGPANKLWFSQQPTTAAVNTAMAPQPIVEVQDVFGNKVTSGAEATGSVTLSLISGTGTLAGLTSLNAISGSADFSGSNLAIDRAGTKSLKATLGSFTLNSSPFSITSVPTQIIWSGSTSVVRGACGQFSITSLDAVGDITNVASDLNITLGGAGAGGFYSDNTCATSIVSTAILQNSSSRTIYYKSSTSGNYTFTADVVSFTQAPYAITVVAGPPVKLAWSGPTFAGPGICSSALTITTQDSTNQATLATDNLTVTLGGQGSGSFYSNSGCTTPITEVAITAGTSTATLYFKNGLAESTLLTASATSFTQGVYGFLSRYPILYLTGAVGGGSTLDGVPITSCGGGSRCYSSVPYIVSTTVNFHSITMVSGAYMVGSAWTSGSPATGNGILQVSTTNELSICGSCLIHMDAKGFKGSGPGLGGLNGGGGHGGNGGIYPGGVGGQAHDSVTNPISLGGSGEGTDGVGGGMVNLLVGGTLTLNGTIQANGIGPGLNGGAGGTIKINTNAIDGSTGSLRANGGPGQSAGAGGRIALVYVNDNFTGGISALTKDVMGGAGTSPEGNGGGGTIFYRKVGVDLVGHLIVKNNYYPIGNYSSRLASTTLLSDTLSTNFDSISVSGNSILEVSSGVFNLPTTGTLDFPLVLDGGSLGNIPNNDLTISSTGILWLPGTGLDTFNNLTVNGKIYLLNYNATVATYKLALNILNDLTIGASGLIDVTGHGFTGGGPGYGGLNGGGGHGGKGGIYPGGTAGIVHDSMVNPNSLGGSGEGTDGIGGGLVDLTVSGTLTLNGIIKADGIGPGLNGGAGGTIKINTNIIAGTTGQLRANGGPGQSAGGGGRLVLAYNSDSFVGGVAAISKQVTGGTGSSGVGNGYPGTIYVTPKLDLDFSSGVLPAMINFSRSSAGSFYNSSGVLTFAALDQPRFDFNPSDNSALGLLIEPQRSNEILYSEDLSQAYWNKQELTLANSSLAPDGTTVPFKIDETITTSTHNVNINHSLTSNQDYVLSFYAKPAQRNWVVVTTSDLAGTLADSYINTTTGALGTSQHESVITQPINNGWYRVYVQFNAGAGVSTPTIAIGTASADTVKTFLGSAGTGLYIWGVQLEAAKYGTSYIDTNGALATRNADVAVASDLSWFIPGSSSRGTFILDVQLPFVDYSMPFLQIDNGTSASSHRLGINSGTYATHYLMKESATNYINLTNSTWANGNRKKVCAAFRPGAANLSTAGATVSAGAPSVMATGLTTLRLGADHLGTSFSGHIIRVQFVRDNFTDESCKQISQ